MIKDWLIVNVCVCVTEFKILSQYLLNELLVMFLYEPFDNHLLLSGSKISNWTR